MLIDRNNYETFFLLYADDELCAEERLAVVNFVAVNEDLRGELNLITAAILPADVCTFTQKESLYKNSFIDGSLQEKLLLKIDNELSSEAFTALNKIVLTNQTAVQEEQLLLATKLDASEIIICPQKELLYKKERGTVNVFRLIKWAVAATLIGFGLFFGFSVFNKKALPNDTVAIKENKVPAGNKPDNISVIKERNITVVILDSDNGKKQNNNKVRNITGTTNLAVNKKDKTEKDLNEKFVVVEQKELAFNKEVQKTVYQTVNTAIENVSQPAIAFIDDAEKNKLIVLANDNIVPSETTYAQAVSFTENETGNNKILYMDEEDIRRSKVGMVFKKFKRMIERTAKIKTGNPLRIASFEIVTN